MEKVEMWKAFDGAIFPSEAACKSHEREHSYLRLVGLTLEQVTGAVNGEDPSLGIAIEIVGAAIARSRRNRGELRKASPKKSGDADDGAPNAPGEDAAVVESNAEVA